MRRQADQVAKAMAEQARAGKDMTTAVQNIAKQITLLTRTNREHSTVVGQILAGLSDIQRIAERNTQGVQNSRRAISSLLEQIQTIITSIDRLGRKG